MFKPRQVLQPSTTHIDIGIEANIFTLRLKLYINLVPLTKRKEVCDNDLNTLTWKGGHPKGNMLEPWTFSVIEKRILKHILWSWLPAPRSRLPSLTGLGLRKTLWAKSRWKNRQNPRDPNDQCLAVEVQRKLIIVSWRWTTSHNTLFSTTEPNSIDFVATNFVEQKTL